MKRTNSHRPPALKALALGLLLIGNSTFANNFNIDVSNDDIAIDANNASLTEVLKEIEKLTGIPVKFLAETDERVTLNVSLTNIESAIGKITPNHMIVHHNKDGKISIKELIIIPADSDLAGSGSGSDFLPNGNPTPDIAQTPTTPNDNPEFNQPATAEDQPVDPLAPADNPEAVTETGNDGQEN